MAGRSTVERRFLLTPREKYVTLWRKDFGNGNPRCQEFGFLQEGIKMKGYLVLFSLIFSMSIALAGQTLAADESLILFLPFNEEGGNKVIDKSQYGNDGAIENCEWVAGKFGKALEFDGESSRLEIPSSDSLNPEEELSVAMWFKSSGQLGAAEGARFMDKWGMVGHEKTPNVDENSGYVVAFFPGANEDRLVLTYNANDFAGMSFILPFDGEWHHIAVVLDTTVNGLDAIQMYLDGNSEEVTPFFLPPPSGVPITPNDLDLKIGCGNNPWNFFKGTLDDVVMFSRLLSEDEVKALASSPHIAVATPDGKLAVSWGTIKKN